MGCTTCRMVLVTGDGGIGKSSLAVAAARRAAQRGTRVLLGACLPLSDTLPLLAVTEALRGIPELGTVWEGLPEYAREEVARLLPGAVGKAGVRGDVAMWRQARQFAAIREALTSVAPVL